MTLKARVVARSRPYSLHKVIDPAASIAASSGTVICEQVFSVLIKQARERPAYQTFRNEVGSLFDLGAERQDCRVAPFDGVVPLPTSDTHMSGVTCR